MKPTPEIEWLHAKITRLEALGSWYIAKLLRARLEVLVCDLRVKQSKPIEFSDESNSGKGVSNVKKS